MLKAAADDTPNNQGPAGIAVPAIMDPGTRAAAGLTGGDSRHRAGDAARRALHHALICAGILSGACAVLPAAWADDAGDDGIQEVTVTAQRFQSTVQDTPLSISAITGAQLDAAGITSIEQFTQDVPGLSMRTAGPGQTEYEARGLASSGGSAPTVGFYLDDVPLTPPATSQTGKVVIDPDLYDVDRIELLRGPQGTLYGSGSMGGTVRLITNAPQLGIFDGSVQGTLSDTQGGSGNGGGSFMLNLPVGDVLAVRVVGTDTYRSGWIDRVVLSPFPEDVPFSSLPAYGRGNVLTAPVQEVVPDVNTESLGSARVSVLFQPNEDFSVTARAFYQHMSMGGYDEFDDPPGGSYEANYFPTDIPEPIGDWVHLYSLAANWNLGFADVTSTSGYFQRHEEQTQNASESISWFSGVYPYFPAPYSEIDLTRQFSEELRLSSKGDDPLRWVVGAFYSDDRSDWNEYGASDGAEFLAMQPDGVIYDGDLYYGTRQYALFGNVAYKITDHWKFETGLRWYHYRSVSTNEASGFFAPPPAPWTQYSTADDGVTPRFDLSYSVNETLTAYLSASKGFRPGGPAGPDYPAECGGGQTPSYNSDSVWDYELGEKAKLFDNWLSINADVYYIKWSGVQETVALPCGYTYEANAGDGRSYGPELEIDAKLSREWSIQASGSYTDAKINHPTSEFVAAVLTNPVAAGIPGCPSATACSSIPILNVPRDAASLSLVYSRPVFASYVLTGRVSDAYVGQAYDQAYAFGIPLPAYDLVNARLGLGTDKWTATLFVDNLTDKIAELATNNTQFQFNVPQLVRVSTNQPRTFGAEINYRF
ncbi:MAG TPA: TonB-dependent receptor [Steroidobacteraceae bacterium]|nr:TonB-dependent receptor [Steroidobacteraceae bacterium]